MNIHLLLFWGRNSNKKDADKYKAFVAQAEAWTPCDTTITWDASEAYGSYSFEREYVSAKPARSAKAVTEV